jgi:hypothetical protein
MWAVQSAILLHFVYLYDITLEYLKDKIDELATNSKNKNIRDLYRGMNGFKRGY